MPKTIYMKRTCDECPWRKDVPPGQFLSERYKSLHHTCVGGGVRPMFACHKSTKEEEMACAGFLLVHGSDSNMVRINVLLGHIDLEDITAAAPLYSDFAALAKANGYDPGDDWDDQNKDR